MFDIKLVVFDVDGVLTDGKKTVTELGAVLSKQFNDKNWTAMKQLKTAGVEVAILSGDPWNRTIFEKRNFRFWDSRRDDGILDKARFVEVFEKEYGCDRKQIAYVGDDLFDLDIMRLVGYPFCPKDACQEVIEFATLKSYPEVAGKYLILDKNGGDAVVGSLYQRFISWGLPAADENLVRKIDSLEKA